MYDDAAHHRRRGGTCSYCAGTRRARLSVFLVVPILLMGCTEPIEIDYSGPVADWAEYGKVKGGNRYSSLDQITRDNVDRLEVAWTYETGHVTESGVWSSRTRPSWSTTRSFACTPTNQVIALDPETGRESWKFDPEVSSESAYVMNCRGVSTWLDQSAPTDAVCRRRIIMGTVDARMLEVDARTGVPCSDFRQQRPDRPARRARRSAARRVRRDLAARDPRGSHHHRRAGAGRRAGRCAGRRRAGVRRPHRCAPLELGSGSAG